MFDYDIDIKVIADIENPGFSDDSEPKAFVLLWARANPVTLGLAILGRVAKMLKVNDDAGLDWFTFGDRTFIGGGEWKVSDNPHVAEMVNVANYLRYGERRELDSEEILKTAPLYSELKEVKHE